jgi:predicted RNase H-like HicB family nuclease
VNFQVIIKPEDGRFVTFVPALDFASTYGPTRESALERTQEMIAGYLEAGGATITVELVDVAVEGKSDG